jgi:2-polyprenyl-6-methoxyphenol hydroxylase-like FAD-dependent oxidoreductase
MVSFNLVPGAGEIFQQPFLTHDGVVAAILIEAVPGGPLEPAVQIDPAADPRTFVSTLLQTIGEFAPGLAARIDPRCFAPLGELDVLRGGVTPTARRAWATLPDGRLVLAIGDAWVVNDPITGQGANIGSHCAWHLAAALASTERLDEHFARRLEDELWSFAGPVTAWTNAFLRPPPTHVLELLAAATAHQPVADAFANGFADPAWFAAQLASPEATAAFVQNSRQLVEV